MKEQIVKLFGSSAGERSNFWIEGQRLLEAGFNPGAQYTQIWSPDRLTFVTGTAETGARLTTSKTYGRKVNTQGNHPAIRVEGVKLKALFGAFKTVKVTYENERITVVGHERADEASVPVGVVTHAEPLKEAA
jgi:hypothetical protein